MTESAATLLDEFAIERELGRGGMGVVQLVRRANDGHPYAVKQTLVEDEASRRALMAELQVWSDLPRHPNLARCFFFRIEADTVFVFAEYVDAGSLQDWIEDGRLHEGDPDRATLRAIDFAIQFAWGLVGLHRLGLVHQDVKPGNVLITSRGVVKITDFGITGGGSATPTPGAGAQSTIRGGTPGYFSPEQAVLLSHEQSFEDGAQLPRLSEKSDVWSWAISVLEMFQGATSCPNGGHLAGRELEKYLLQRSSATASEHPGGLAIPNRLQSLLRHCFEPNVDHRPSLEEAAEVLKQVYAELAGGGYRRPLAPWPDSHGDTPPPVRTWLGPDFWAEKLRRRGWQVRLPDRMRRSAKGHVIADIVLLSELEPYFRHDDDDDGNAIEIGEDAIDRIQIRIAQARAYRRINDVAMALHCLQIANQRCFVDAQRVYMPWTATVAREEAGLLAQQGRQEDAHEALRDALALLDVDTPYVSELVRCRVAAGDLLEGDEALASLQGTLQACREFPESGESGLLIAAILTALARQLLEQGRDDADGHLDRAFRIYTALLESSHSEDIDLHQHEARLGIARCSLIEASREYAAGNLDGATAAGDRAVALFERIVLEGGCTEFAADLADAWGVRAMTLVRTGATQAAIRLRQRCSEYLERCVSEDGRVDLTCALARTHLDQAATYQGNSVLELALTQLDRAEALYDRVRRAGRHDVSRDLLVTRFLRAQTYAEMGQVAHARTDAQSVCDEIDRMAEDGGHADLERIRREASAIVDSTTAR